MLHPRDEADEAAADESPAADERAGRWLRFAIPPLVLGAFLLALVAEPPPADVDLMLVAPDYARPGSSLPLRALAVAGLAESGGPTTPLARPMRVTLLDESGRPLAETTLVAGAADTFEGELTIPPGVQGRLSLRARMPAPWDGEPIEVKRLVQVSEDAAASTRRGRLATPTQRWRPESIEALDGGTPPRDLDLRVLGGACAPELPCELRLWVGEPAAEVELESSPSLSVESSAHSTTSGIVPFGVTVHGAEAVAHLVARREGALVARRSVRLPILMAGHGMRLPQGSLVVGAPARPELEVSSLNDSRRFVVDAYLDGHWLHTATLELDGDGRGRLPYSLAPGLWRLSVHRDPFSTLRSAGRLVLVLAPGADPMSELRRLAASPELAVGTDPLANLLVSGRPPPGSAEQVSELLFALPELDFYQMPDLAHGILQLGPDVDPGRRALRALAGGLVLLAGFLVAWMLIRRGQAAGHQADLLLADAQREAAEDDEQDAGIVYARSPRQSSRGLFAAAGFVILVFAIGALLVVSRGCMS